jgi:hypothetical protein
MEAKAGPRNHGQGMVHNHASTKALKAWLVRKSDL